MGAKALDWKEESAWAYCLSSDEELTSVKQEGDESIGAAMVSIHGVPGTAIDTYLDVSMIWRMCWKFENLEYNDLEQVEEFTERVEEIVFQTRQHLGEKYELFLFGGNAPDDFERVPICGLDDEDEDDDSEE